MTPGTHATSGLYALKPWYTQLLSGVRSALVRRGTSPDLISATGVGFAALAGASLALLPQGWAALAVGPLLALRLAAANLDGAVARERGIHDRRGTVVNEVGDRLADLAMLAGCLAFAPAWLVVTVMLTGSAPSWVALAGAAAGADRINGGPVGKTERCLLVTLIAAIPGSGIILLVVIIAGSVATAIMRAVRLGR